MNRAEDPETAQDELDVLQKRKRQLWIIVAVMLVSFCMGTAALLTILWFVFKTIR